MDYAAIAQVTVAFLTPYFVVAGGKLVEDSLSAAREKVVSWLKSKFTKPAQTAAVEVAAKAPHDADALEALQHQIQLALERDEAFRKQLLELLPEEVKQGISQSMHVSGNGNVSIQSTGSGSTSVQR
ncbi:MAG: hypothetical protein WA117_14640 [Verrucomicrobiia bacterium]